MHIQDTTLPMCEMHSPTTGTSSTMRRLRKWKARNCSWDLRKTLVMHGIFTCGKIEKHLDRGLLVQYFFVRVLFKRLGTLFLITAETVKVSQTRKPKCSRGDHCSRNAYMLVYKRQREEGDSKETNVDVPGNLPCINLS